MRFGTKTQGKNNRDSIDELLFDKIPHRKSRSPKELVINQQEDIDADEEDQQSITRSQGVIGINDLIAAVASAQEEEKSFKVQPQATGFFFKSYEDIKNNSNLTNFEKHRPQHHMLPLYENALYHQNRLSNIAQSQDRNYNHGVSIVPTTNANILYHNVKQIASNPFNFRNVHQRQLMDPYLDDNARLNRSTLQPQNSSNSSVVPVSGSVTFGGPKNYKQQANGQLMRPSTQQESSSIPISAQSYSNFNPQKVPNSSLSRPKPHHGSNTDNNNTLIHPILANEIESLSRKMKQSSLNKQALQQVEESYTNRQQVDNQQQNETNSVQRISFKELLESSRQQRVQVLSVDRQQSKVISSLKHQQHQNMSNGGLMHMLKNSYQMFQQQNNVTSSVNVGGIAIPSLTALINSDISAIQAINDETHTHLFPQSSANVSLQNTQREVQHIASQPNIVMINKKDIVRASKQQQLLSAVTFTTQQPVTQKQGESEPKSVSTPQKRVKTLNVISSQIEHNNSMARESANINTIYFKQRAPVAPQSCSVNTGQSGFIPQSIQATKQIINTTVKTAQSGGFIRKGITTTTSHTEEKKKRHK